MSLTHLYRHAWAALAPDGFYEIDAVEPPRGPEWLYEVLDDIELEPGSRILDLACGPGEQAAVLARRYEARVIGLDPVVAQLRAARAGGSIRVAAGRMEVIPIEAGSIDLVWLRDALLHSGDPEATLAGCHRVLRAGGHMLLHTAYATELLSDRELELLESEMHVARASLDMRRVDRGIAAAGFELLRTDLLGSELAEHYEAEDGLGSRALMRLARMNRAPDLRGRLGDERYRAARGLYHWVVFELLGKLTYRTTLLRRPA